MTDQRQILHGIEYIHNALGICHGSIDITSVLVTKDGGVKIGERLGPPSPTVRKPDLYSEYREEYGETI